MGRGITEQLQPPAPSQTSAAPSPHSLSSLTASDSTAFVTPRDPGGAELPSYNDHHPPKLSHCFYLSCLLQSHSPREPACGSACLPPQLHRHGASSSAASAAPGQELLQGSGTGRLPGLGERHRWGDSGSSRLGTHPLSDSRHTTGVSVGSEVSLAACWASTEMMPACSSDSVPLPGEEGGDG